MWVGEERLDLVEQALPVPGTALTDPHCDGKSSLLA